MKLPVPDGTHRIHHGKGNCSVFQGGEFGVLAADFNNGVHLGIDLIGGAGTCTDLIEDQVHTPGPADKYAPGPGGAGAQNR